MAWRSRQVRRGEERRRCTPALASFPKLHRLWAELKPGRTRSASDAGPHQGTDGACACLAGSLQGRRGSALE